MTQEKHTHNKNQGTGGDALVAGIKAHNIDTVFGLPGGQTYGLFDALYRENVRIIGSRHEQGCGYMAFGYTRATGKPSVFSVVPGPGVLNAGAAALTAFSCNEPILCLTGEVPSDFLDGGSGHLHEMPDQLGTMRSFYKRAERVEHPSLASQTVSLCFQTMMAGRRGPAAIEMPWEIFTKKSDIGSAEKLPDLESPPVDHDKIEEAAELISKSKAPMIFVGGGAFDAADNILKLAQRLEAPVVGFRSGRGIVSNANELGLSIAEAYELWPQTDLIIGIGTRLEIPRMRWPVKNPDLKIIRIDIDPAEMRRHVPSVAIVADAQDATQELVDAVENTDKIARNRLDDIRKAREVIAPQVMEIKPQAQYLAAIRDILPDNGIVTDELSQVGFTSWYAYPVYEPRTYLTSGYQGNLGSGFPTALGAKIAYPDRPVVAITGDGGFMFGVQELATAVQFNIAVVVLVFNNNTFGNVRRDQMNGFEGRVVSADLVNPDFIELSKSFGVEAERVSDIETFKKTLEKAISKNVPYLIEIETPTDSETNPWRFIQPNRPAAV